MRNTLLLGFLMGVFISFAQENSDFEKKLGSWYMFSGSSTAKVDIHNDFMVMSQVLDHEDDRPVPKDSIHILSKGGNGLLLCEKKDEKEMAVLRLTIEEGVLQITEVLTSDDRSVLEEEMNSNSAISGKELFKANYLYSEEIFRNLENARGLDEVTAEDLETALLKRNAYGRQLEEIIRKDPESAPDNYRIGRLGRKHLNRTFLTLGYNPFKDVEYNFETMFPNRPDLMELLNGF